MNQVAWHGSKAELLAVLYKVPQYLTGKIDDSTGSVERMYERIGMAVLDIIHAAYVIKANQDEDEAGERWQMLAPSTVRRRKARGTWPPETILIETGRLVESLMPKSIGLAGDQVFVIFSNGVAIGTKVPYAIKHHLGDENLPQRRLWAPFSQWPDEWKGRIFGEIRSGIVELLTLLLARV